MEADSPNPEARPLHPALRFEAVPYQPDGGCPFFGTLVVFTAVLLAALGMGLVTSWVSQWFYIILLFPVVVGVGVGFGGAVGVVLGKVRSTLVTALAGLFAGCVAMTAHHYFNYERFLQQPRAENRAPQKNAGAAGPQAPARGQGGPTGFLNYLDRRARKGVPVHFRRLHFNLGYVGSYIYWAVEIVIVAGFAIGIMWSFASEPFCTVCHTWKAKRPLGTLDMAPETAASIFTAGEIVRLADDDFIKGEGQIQAAAWVCPTCEAEAPVDVKLDRVTKNAKDEEETKQLVYLTYPGEALPVLESLFAVDES
jgi:hypothetical protein